MARNAEERAIDKLLSAYVINECIDRYDVKLLSETKLQKLIFLSERKLIQNWSKGFNYSYMFFEKGPYSGQVRSDFRVFKKLFSSHPKYLEYSDELNLILEDFGYLFERNDDIIIHIDRILKRYARLPLEVLISRVYALKHRGRRIGSLPFKTPLLWKLSEDKAETWFELTDEEYVDLSECFDPKLNEILDSAMEDMRRGRLLSQEEVFRQL